MTPDTGALALAWLIGLGAVAFGTTLLVSAWRQHRLEKTRTESVAQLARA